VRSEWDVVAQLALQLLNRNVEDGGDVFLAAVLEEAKQFTKAKRWSALSFAVRCLEFIVPNPKLAV